MTGKYNLNWGKEEGRPSFRLGSPIGVPKRVLDDSVMCLAEYTRTREVEGDNYESGL